jgi:hypothetical protein
LGAYTDNAEFGHRIRSPPVLDGIRREPLHRTGVMFMLRHQQRHEHVDLKKRNHSGRLFGTIHETVDILDFEDWGARSSRKYRHAMLKTHIRVSDPPEQGICELIDLLAGLACQISEP